MRKIISIFALLLIVLGLAGCTNKVDLQEAASLIEVSEIVENNQELIYLPTLMNGADVEWTSSHPNIISAEGVVTHPNKDTLVFMTAKLTYKKDTYQVQFPVTVKAQRGYSILEFEEWLKEQVYYKNVVSDITLPTTHPIQGGSITWSSSNIQAISASGVVTRQEDDVLVELNATITFAEQEKIVTFEITVIKNEEPTPQMKYQLVIEEISSVLDLDNTKITSKPNFPSHASFDSVIVWRSSHPEILDIDTYNPSTADVEVTMYYTVTIDSVTFEENSITITVKQKTTDPVDPVELSSYYEEAEGLSGTALVSALRTIITRNHKLYSYSTVWDILKESDEDPNNTSNVILFYTGRSQSKSSNGGGTSDWNREHVWPQSRGGFGTGTGPGTDAHHLRPTDVKVNGTRGNKDYDEGGSIVNDYAGVPTLNRTTSSTFEPRDLVKGDAARMIFYMSIRYNLEVRESVGTGVWLGRLSTMLRWNEQDLPDSFEQNRNEVVYEWQKNRNPFIDYPHLANLIWQRSGDLSYNLFSYEASLLNGPAFSVDALRDNQVSISSFYQEVEVELIANVEFIDKTRKELRFL